MRKPAAKSVILDLLSTMRDRALPVAAIVSTGTLFGIQENSIRVTLTRLVAAGLLGRDERGVYRLAASAAPIDDLVTSWRTVERNVRAWNGRWIGIHTANLSRLDRGIVRRRSRALAYLGFRELRPGLEIRPDNLEGGVDRVRERLHQLGLEEEAPVFRIDSLDPETEAEAKKLWDAKKLVERYRSLREALSRSAARIPTLPRDRARVESFLLGGEAIRQIVLDPLLPEPLVPVEERRALLEVMLHYDRLGRACWAGAFEKHGATQERAPAHFGALDRGRVLAESEREEMEAR